MKHLHLITGLLISIAMAGCGDYGDDGAVNSIGTDDGTGATDFTLAVAVPTFGEGSAGKPRLRTQGEAPVAHAVTGSTAYTVLARSDVRAFVIVTDSGNASGYREVPIEVVEFDNLGNGRYRIAIDGQAQVDGFFAISIDGIVYRVPMSRTGSTDAPIDVNALQAALADRLQALLVANDVCSGVTVDQLNTLLDAAGTYVDGLSVPDDINDVAALIEFYRVSVASFMRERVEALCAPALDNEAILALVGNYHSLSSGLQAGYDADGLPVLESFSTLKASRALVLDETNPALATFSGNDTYDDRFTVTFGGEAGAYGVFQDLSVQNPERDPGIDNLSFAAFAGDANRAVVKYGDVAKTTYIDTRVFVPGFVVTLTPAWQQFAHDGTLFGASQSATTVFDLSQATATCLAAVGLTSAALTDSEEFFRLAGLALQQPGEDALGKALLANCGPGAPLGYGVSLHVDTPRTTDFGITEMTGRFAVVSLEPALLAGSDAATSGVGGFASDGVFDIDDEGVLQALDGAGVITQFSLDSTLLAAGDSPLSGQREVNSNDDDLTRIDVPLDGSQNPVTTGELQLEITAGNNVNTYNGFASASRDLFAFDLATTEQGSSIGSGLGGLFLVGEASGFYSDILAIQGNYVYAVSSGSGSMRIMDVSNPAQMNVAGLYSASQAIIQEVAVSGNYAYLSLGSNGLDIVNILDPKAPEQVTRLGSPSLGAAKVSGNFVYGAEAVSLNGSNSSILHVIDVSTPTLPAAIGSLDLSTLNTVANDPAEYVTSIAVSGSRLYVVSFAAENSDWRLRIIDASVSQGVATLTPVGLRSLGNINTVRDIKVVDGAAYLALGNDGIAIFDVSNPAQILDQGDAPTNGSAQSLWVTDNRLSVIYDNSEGPSGLSMFDVSNPLQPTELGDIRINQVGDVVGAGDYVYIGTDWRDVGLLSANVGTAPVQTKVDAPALSFYSQEMVASGNYLYVLGYSGANDDLQVFDISSPEQPISLTSITIANNAAGFAISGNRAYFADASAGLVVADITDPQQPGPLAGAQLGGSPSDIAVSGGHAYVTDLQLGLQIFNIASTPVAAPTVSTSGNANAVAISGNYAFVATDAGLDAINITTPTTATLVSSQGSVDNLVAIAISGNYAYVASNASGDVAVVNISDPTAMTVVHHIAAWAYSPQQQLQLRVAGDKLYVLDSTEISIIDISDPLNAFGTAHLDRTDMESLGGLAVVGQYLFEGSVLPNESPVLTVHNLLGTASSTEATTGLAIGVRIDQDPPAVADLVGKQFTLTGQQAGQSSDQTEAAAGLGIIAGGSLRFVQVGTEVLPVFDLPLSSVVIADFSSVTPRLAVQFDQWTPAAVNVNANGRVSFMLTNTVTDTVANFAGYLGDNGLLVGRFDSLTLAPGSGAVTVDPQVTRYPGLAKARSGIFVGVPRQLPALR